MLLFHRIDDAFAIVRLKGGVYKQTELYRRGDRIYIKHGAGYVRVNTKFGETWGTTAPGVNVVDMSDDIGGFDRGSERQEPRWTGKQGAEA